jgi:hypothetical protein
MKLGKIIIEAVIAISLVSVCSIMKSSCNREEAIK